MTEPRSAASHQHNHRVDANADERRLLVALGLIANYAEVQNGLVYVAGGGWSEHWRLVPAGGPPARSRFSVALAIGVDWNETNRPHQVTVSVEDVDGNGVVEATAGFTLGRPPMLSEGSSQLAAVAMTIEVVFPREGEYRVIARVGGQSEAGIDTLTGRVRIVTFRVHDVAGPPQSAAA